MFTGKSEALDQLEFPIGQRLSKINTRSKTILSKKQGKKAVVKYD
jgi:hypothetical protein